MDVDWSAEERVPIRRMLTPADILSLANGLLGFLAIITALNGEVRATFTLILLAVLFDGLDGHLSRLGYGGGRLGDKMDTLSDLVSFCVAPALLLYNQYGHRAWFPATPGVDAPLASAAVAILIAALYFATGLLRLARFDYLKGGERDDYFVGVTTPGAATILASVALLGWQPVPALLTVLLTALLMVSRVRLPKARSALAVASGVLVLVAAILGDAFHNLGPILLLVAFAAYLVLGPGYVRRHEEPDEEPRAAF